MKNDYEIDEELKLLVIPIEARTDYKWVPEIIKYGTGSIVMVFDTGGLPGYVACKIITGNVDERRLKNFLREIVRSLKAQGHPLIAKVYFVLGFDFPGIGKRPVIFMRFYEKNLREYMLEKKSLGVDEALALMVQIVKGLLYLKHRGFVAHQDLKPENILLENVCKEFEQEKIPHQLCYRPAISDFGLANAWLEAGIPGGTNPYRAPEQFTLYKREKAEELYKVGLFNPDVFALGAILTEMLTGKHPSGILSSEVMERSSDKAFWLEWSVDRGRRVVEVDHVDLKQLILRMLDPVPKSRPSLEEVYEGLLRILKKVNPELYERLNVLLEYYDEISREYEGLLSDINMLRYNLMKLSKLPEAKEIIVEIIENMKQRLKEFAPPKHPEDVHKYISIQGALGDLMMVIDPDRYREEVKSMGVESLNIVIQWINRIGREHTLYRDIKVPDDEARAYVLEEALELLEKVVSLQEIEALISKYNDYMKALYYYIKASRACEGANYKEALRYIDEALRYSPNNDFLLFIRALYKYHYSRILLMVEEMPYACTMMKEAIEELKNISVQEVLWEEPREWLAKAKAEYENQCKQ
uniref:Protein kinase domain-containing protein n=1 Tax=Ignisphaera aggregans TaxID=334771 RepID=A0A7J2TAJ0_9CREN